MDNPWKAHAHPMGFLTEHTWVAHGRPTGNAWAITTNPLVTHGHPWVTYGRPIDISLPNPWATRERLVGGPWDPSRGGHV